MYKIRFPTKFQFNPAKWLTKQNNWNIIRIYLEDFKNKGDIDYE